MAFQYNYASPDRYLLLKEFAKINKQHPTEAESVLWEFIRANQLWFKFNRQYIIGDYIVDFVCLEKALVLEVDGAYHSEYEQIEKDKNRTDHLQNLGFKVLRFTNDEVMQDIEGVLQTIRDKLFGL